MLTEVAGGQGVQDCPEAGPNVYCCYGQSGCDCTDPDQLVTALPRSVVATLDLSGMVISNTPSISPPPTSTPSTTTVSTSTSTKTPQTQGSKSSAVPIGVGVGAGGAVLIAVTATAFFLRRRRRQNSPSLGPQLEYETKPDEVRHELMTISNTAELPTKTPVYELPAHR
ncbi:hypothetical protein V494_03227 [Pseudogymnoascus sp. VKM F-4513 (FW-928)]|nr:hypothetical protein V494_03227 [Pseudogymnoascus sp. VKM F-4513 (FW-928)]